MSDDPDEMAAQAKRCRRLAKWCTGEMRDSMNFIADDYEERERAAKAPRD
jgi:hypothetical protein